MPKSAPVSRATPETIDIDHFMTSGASIQGLAGDLKPRRPFSMLNLKTIWSKKRPDPPATDSTAAPLASIPRPFAPASRMDFPQGLSEPPPPPTDTRAAERFVPRRTSTVLITDSGKKIAARIINVSATGIAIEADLSQIQPQSIVMVGERRVQMGRKISRGTVFLFDSPLPKHICGPDFIA